MEARAGRRVRIVDREGQREADFSEWAAWVFLALGLVVAVLGCGERADARAYARQVAPPHREYRAAALAFTRLHRDLAARPAALDDDAWRRQMADALGALDRTAAAMAAVGPAPARMQATAALVDRLAADTHRLVGEYAAAVDTRDRARAGRAAGRIAAGEDLRARVHTALLEASGSPFEGK